MIIDMCACEEVNIGELRTVVTKERQFDGRAVTVPPVAAVGDGDAVLRGVDIVGFVCVPLLDRQAPDGQLRPSPASEVIVEADPEGYVQILGHVADDYVFQFIGYGGQITFFLPAELLGGFPVRLLVSDKPEHFVHRSFCE